MQYALMQYALMQYALMQYALMQYALMQYALMQYALVISKVTLVYKLIFFVNTCAYLHPHTFITL
jgi:hypothetical protein